MEKRVQVLKEYELLDTLPESEFDDIVELASVFFGMPISLISLLDSHRQWFKARVGLGASETPIEQAFCYHAIQRPDEVMVVPDSFLDDRFRDNPLATGEPHVRFYAGAPLVMESGYAIGTLCVIDRQPGSFTAEQKKVLRILADKVIERFESRRQNLINQRRVAEADEKLKLTMLRLLEAERIAKIGNWDIDLTTGEIYWSPEMYRIFGIAQDTKIIFEDWQKRVHPDYVAEFSHARQKRPAGDSVIMQEFGILMPDGSDKWLLSTIEPSAHDHLVGTTLDITSRKKAEENKRQYTEALEQMLFDLSHKIRKSAANVIGIVNNLDKDATMDHETAELIPYLKSAADELDGYIHELNDFIQKQKIDINHPPDIDGGYR